MTDEQLVSYLNNFNGKSISAKKIVEGIGAIDKQKSREINNILSSQVVNASGAYKNCAYFGDRKVYAALKSKTPKIKQYQKCKLQKTNDIIRLNRELINKGACVPKLYSIFFADEHFIEIFERAKGNVVAVSRIDEFVKKTCGVKHFDKEKTSKFLQNKISKELFAFNLAQQNIIKNLPQECFDKLFNSLCIINNMNMGFDDTHSENIMVSDKGFMLVDLDYENMLLKNGKVNNDTLVAHLFEPFTFSTHFSGFLSNYQFSELNKNNLIIAKKLINAVSNKGVIINNDINYLLATIGDVVGNNALVENFNNLFASQIELRKKLHKPSLKI